MRWLKRKQGYMDWEQYQEKVDNLDMLVWQQSIRSRGLSK